MNPNLVEDGKATRIKPGQRIPGAGRKPSKLKWLQKQYQYSSDDLRSAISATEGMILDKLKGLYKDEKTDVCIRTIAKARINAMVKGDLTALSVLWNRAYGTPLQTIHQKNTDVPFADLPEEDRDQVIEDLLNKYKPMEEKNEPNGDD